MLIFAFMAFTLWLVLKSFVEHDIKRVEKFRQSKAAKRVRSEKREYVSGLSDTDNLQDISC